MAELYVPLDVNAPDDPKVIAAGDMAELVFYRSLCLAKRLQSDGKIASSQVRRLGGDSDVAAALVQAGLWAVEEGGYLIISFLKRNPSRATVDADRRAAADRKAAYRKRSKRDTKPMSPGTGESRPTGLSLSEVKRSEELTREFDEWWSRYPRKVGRQKAREQFEKRRKDGVEFAVLIAARDAYAGRLNGTDDRFVLHASTFLSKDGRWSDDWTDTAAIEDWMNPR